MTAALAVGMGCGEKPTECVDKSKPALDSCQAKLEQLQNDVNKIKLQLAQALQNPGSIKVDPSVLTIDGKPIKVEKGTPEGALTQDQVIATLKQNKGGLQPCYQRALKRDSSLHHRKLVVNVGFQVQSTGAPANITITPNHNSEMVECMKKAIRRWKFPTFTGQPVGVESPVTFTPKDK
ncbi:MAG: AgmX/PglI C-terminal domain-containing protein [Deltaproteobacteria bacterium]|nr:AgmX/PglI C-terminal domain-containing protein [Deltaproteobacteria bacterium]